MKPFRISALVHLVSQKGRLRLWASIIFYVNKKKIPRFENNLRQNNTYLLQIFKTYMDTISFNIYGRRLRQSMKIIQYKLNNFKIISLIFF